MASVLFSSQAEIPSCLWLLLELLPGRFDHEQPVGSSDHDRIVVGGI